MSYVVSYCYFRNFTFVPKTSKNKIARNKILTAHLLHKLRNAFQNFIADTMNWLQNSRSDKETFLRQGLSNQNFMASKSINFKNNVSRSDFSVQPRKIILRY